MTYGSVFNNTAKIFKEILMQVELQTSMLTYNTWKMIHKIYSWKKPDYEYVCVITSVCWHVKDFVLYFYYKLEIGEMLIFLNICNDYYLFLP